MTLVPCYSRGIAYVKKSLAIRQSLGDIWGQGQSLSYYSLVLYAASRFKECAEKSGEAVKLLERTGDYWQVHIALFQYGMAFYRLGDLPNALAQAMAHYRSGIEVGDEQSSGIAVDLWARSSGGAVPEEILDKELQRERHDAQGSVQVLLAKGIQLYGAGQIAESAEYFQKSHDFASRTRIRNAYTTSSLAWLATCRRCLVQRCQDRTPGRRQQLLREAKSAVRKAKRALGHFQCDLPHVLREQGLVLALEGKHWRARRALARSLKLAERQGARYEYAQTLLARGHVAEELGWPHAAKQIRKATALLRKLSASEAGDPGGRYAEAESGTLSLVDRFGTVLDSGRKIAAALSPDAVFREVRSAALHLLRGEQCLVLQIASTESGLDIVPLENDQAFSPTMVETAVQRGRAIAFGDAQADLKSEPLMPSDQSSILCVPIFLRGRPVACLHVTHHHMRGLFGPDEERLADFIATIAGAALENAEGFQQLQRLNATLEQRVADRTAAAEMRATGTGQVEYGAGEDCSRIARDRRGLA